MKLFKIRPKHGNSGATLNIMCPVCNKPKLTIGWALKLIARCHNCNKDLIEITKDQI